MTDPASIPPAAEASDAEELRIVREFLSDRDVYCLACNYNLRGLSSLHCPECGLVHSLPAGSADSGLTDAERMVRWLRDHDLVCKKCKTNLRGGPSNSCPTCGATYMLQHTTMLASHRTAAPRQRQTTSAALLIVAVPLAILFLCIASAMLYEVVAGFIRMVRP